MEGHSANSFWSTAIFVLSSKMFNYPKGIDVERHFLGESNTQIKAAECLLIKNIPHIH